MVKVFILFNFIKNTRSRIQSVAYCISDEESNAEEQPTQIRTTPQRNQLQYQVRIKLMKDKEGSVDNSRTEKTQNTSKLKLFSTRWLCHLCDKVFMSKESLLKHIDGAHGSQIGNEGWLCHFCDKPFREKQRLTEHLSTHESNRNVPNIVVVKEPVPPVLQARKKVVKMVDHGAKRSAGDGASQMGAKRKILECEICQENFTNDKLFTEHRNSHKTKCIYCGKEYATFLLERHLKLFHPKGTYLCLQCDKEFRNKEELVTHVARLHHDNLESDQDDEDELESAGTNVKTANTSKEKPRKRRMRRRGKTENLGHFCDYCDKIFLVASRLQRHLVSRHGAKGKYECEACDKQWHEKGDYAQHLALAHGAPSAFPCTVCNKQFTKPSSLKRHIQVHHEKIGK